jgi:hypothetical protein
MLPTGLAGSELGRRDDEPEAVGPAPEPRIQGDQAAAEQSRERDELGVVGLRPPELVGDLPGDLAEPLVVAG